MKIGDQILLFDKADAHICTFTVDRVDPAFLAGTFIPTDNFHGVRPLFERYADMVEANSIAYVDEVVNKIEEFGIYGTTEGIRTDIFDVQIYGDRGSLRLQPFIPQESRTMRSSERESVDSLRNKINVTGG